MKRLNWTLASSAALLAVAMGALTSMPAFAASGPPGPGTGGPAVNAGRL